MHTSKGIKFHMSASVESAEPSSSDSSHVGSIKLKDGTLIPADLVILGVGVGPATEFLKNSDFNLEKDGSLKVDKYLRVKGVEDVYATGDIATFPYVQQGGKDVRIEHWDVAINHGRSVANHIVKGDAHQGSSLFGSS
jgi:NADPH-dependent 2,4-dienoyl-CoA reductase/sulfur reductase-like enzyme